MRVCGTKYAMPTYVFEKIENLCFYKICMLFIIDKRKTPEVPRLRTEWTKCGRDVLGNMILSWKDEVVILAGDPTNSESIVLSESPSWKAAFKSMNPFIRPGKSMDTENKWVLSRGLRDHKKGEWLLLSMVFLWGGVMESSRIRW